jgi:predicted dehydrogenase/threonine dehydrogenase-like Zn-dependent dehydrogenase
MQSVGSGELKLVEGPVPTPGSTEVLVATTKSVVSAGTERAVKQLANANLMQKAKARPDLVRQVVAKAKAEGVRSTAKAVRNRLDDHMPLGYSGVGIVAEVGEYVDGIRPGMRVATGGAGHGDYQLVPGLLTVSVPDGVSDENAAFATVASIAMHGLRLAELGPGSRICVIGLGLVGQITCRLAQASGYLVCGIDVKEHAIEKAAETGVLALAEEGDKTTRIIREWSKGRGVDAVLVTAASKSSGPVSRSTAILRDRAPLVVVGDVGLELDRRPFYEQELTLKVARSYGPGRYERAYEDWAVDYPAGHVRWTEGRNIESVLDLLDAGTVDFSDLITHTFDVADASKAYEVIEGTDPFYGVQLTYPAYQPVEEPERVVVVYGPPKHKGKLRVGILGAGNFMKATLLPAMKKADFGEIMSICSASGTSARLLADKYKIPMVASDADAIVNDPNIDVVAIATPHDTHAKLVLRSLRAGKHVFCEKPLAMTEEEFDLIEETLASTDRVLQVGFNRRYSPAVVKAKEILGDSGGPLVITYRVNAGELPESHWYHDRRFGGRLVGEACHYVDLCNHLAGDTDPGAAVIGSAVGSPAADENFIITLKYGNGSMATVTYGSNGHLSMEKESLTILGRGKAISIMNASMIVCNAKTLDVGAGTGHTEQLVAMRAVIESGRGLVAEQSGVGGSVIVARLAAELAQRATVRSSPTGRQHPAFSLRSDGFS